MISLKSLINTTRAFTKAPTLQYKNYFWFARGVSKTKTKFADLINQKNQEPEEPQVKEKVPKEEAPENYDDGQQEEPIKFSALSRKKQETQEIISEELDPESKQFAQEELLYRGYDPEPHKLVQRPVKDVVWGLGGELLKRKTQFFEEGKMPSPEDVIMYLEMEQAKDIELIDLEEVGRKDLPKWGIILTGYSSRHMYRMAQNLVKAFENLKIPDLTNPPRIYGGKIDDWILVEFKDIMVHMFTEEARADVDLENRWRNPPTEEEIEDYERRALSLRRKWRRETGNEPRKWY